MEKMIEGARTMLSDKGMLFSMQEGSACMVKEWLDNEANVQKYLDGLEYPALSV
jgi:hypothetical protein